MWNQACLRRSIDLMQVSLNSQFSILNPQSSMTLHAALHSEGAKDGGDDCGNYLKDLLDLIPTKFHNLLCVFSLILLLITKDAGDSERKARTGQFCVFWSVCNVVYRKSPIGVLADPPGHSLPAQNLRGLAYAAIASGVITSTSVVSTCFSGTSVGA